MSIKKLAAAAAFVAVSPAFAAISGNTAGQSGELFLSVYDAAAKVSYTLDLSGFDTQAAFKSLADGNEAGFATSWNLAGDANWTTFTSQADLSSSKWMVLSVEKNLTGATLQNGVRLFTTVKAGDEGKVGSNSNLQFTTFIGQFQNFFNAVNSSGTHGVIGQPADYAVDGSSVNYEADNGAGYVGDGSTGGLSSNFNQNFNFSNATAIGGSAGFAFLTRSNNQSSGMVLVDSFANSAGAGQFSFGSNGLLSYTLAAAVPEPSSYAMLLVGLLSIGGLVRRRQQR